MTLQSAPNNSPLTDANGFVNPIWAAYFDSLSRDIAPSVTPAGSVTAYEGSTEPNGWLFCDGRELARSQYVALFNTIGTRYGSGNGSTTFNIPDRRGKFLRGTSSMGVVEEGGAEDTLLSPANIPAVNVLVSDPGHAHLTTDPGHTHTVADPGHFHAKGVKTNSTGTTGTDPSVETDNTGSAVTGITINSATTGVVVRPNTTGITAITENGNTPVSIIPPFVSVSFIIKY